MGVGARRQKLSGATAPHEACPLAHFSYDAICRRLTHAAAPGTDAGAGHSMETDMDATDEVSVAAGADERIRASLRGLEPQARDSAISWGAIFAGAAAAAVLALLMLLLGAAFGMLSLSFLPGDYVSKATFSISVVGWLAFTQLVAFGTGGYLAGRLRTKWVGLQRHEAFFRDSAHGFLAWTVAWLSIVTLVAFAAGSMFREDLSLGIQPAGAAAHAVTAKATASPDALGAVNPLEQSMNQLFRTADGGNAVASSDSLDLRVGARLVAYVFMNKIVNGGPLLPVERHDIGRLIAAHTGLSQQDAERRVEGAYTQLKTEFNQAKRQAEKGGAATSADDQDRMASARVLLWLFALLLIGGLAAVWAAAWGGYRRDFQGKS